MVLRVLDLSPCGGIRYICGTEDDSGEDGYDNGHKRIIEQRWARMESDAFGVTMFKHFGVLSRCRELRRGMALFVIECLSWRSPSANVVYGACTEKSGAWRAVALAKASVRAVVSRK